jgi:hypothetical protein
LPPPGFQWKLLSRPTSILKVIYRRLQLLVYLKKGKP